MSYHRARLLWRGNSCPHREKRRHIFVGRALAVFKVIVEVQTSLAVPKIFLNALFALFRSLSPFFRVSRTPEHPAHLLQIALRFVEQAVQTYRCEMVRPRPMRSKAKRDVVARFPHRAVALVIVRTQ